MTKPGFGVISVIIAFACLASASLVVESRAQDKVGGVETVETDGAPFAVVPSADSHHLYVTVSRVGSVGHPGLGSYALGDHLTQDGFVPLDDQPVGAALSHDGRFLAVAATSSLYLLKVDDLAKGKAAILWKIATDSSIGAAFSLDDHILFVPEERKADIDVIVLGDHADLRPDRAKIGAIPTGDASISVVPSPDGRYLYATSQVGPAAMHGKGKCTGEQDDSGRRPEGAILTIDMAKVETDPRHSVLAAAPAGCTTVRLALSKDGRSAYATARRGNEVLFFDTQKLLDSPDNAITGSVAVDGSPVGVALDEKRQLLFVARSDRFANPPRPSTVAVIDLADKARMVGQIPAGIFPREVAVTPDNRWLIISNYLSGMVEKIDLDTLISQPE